MHACTLALVGVCTMTVVPLCTHAKLLSYITHVAHARTLATKHEKAMPVDPVLRSEHVHVLWPWYLMTVDRPRTRMFFTLHMNVPRQQYKDIL